MIDNETYNDSLIKYHYAGSKPIGQLKKTLKFDLEDVESDKYSV